MTLHELITIKDNILSNYSNCWNKICKIHDHMANNGKGYIVLDLNKTFSEQVKNENTIYEILYDFNLNETTVTIPNGCTLKFNGGSIINGTINGQNTNVISDFDNIFGNTVVITGTWNVYSAKLDWFTPDENNCYDNSFINAFKMSKIIECKSKTYDFSGSWIDCRNLSNRFTINGNHSYFNKFHFAYDVTTGNDTHISSGVSRFYNIIKNITFRNLNSANTPALFIGSYTSFEGCNFTGYDSIIAFPDKCYIDYFSWNGGLTYQVNTIFTTLKYDFSEGSYFTADWFYLNNVHHEGYVLHYKDGQSVNMLCQNCLHFKFKFTFTNYYASRTQILFNNCHWENTSPILEISGTINPQNTCQNLLTFQNCFFYSSAIPDSDILNFCKFKQCIINLPNSDNYANLNFDKILNTNPENLHIFDDSGEFVYDSISFYQTVNSKIQTKLMPSSPESYYIAPIYYLGISTSKCNYTESQNVSYFIGWSMKKDVLYNDGDTPTTKWSNPINIPAGKCANIELYNKINKGAYLHIYKHDLTNDVIHYIVLPTTNISVFNISHSSISLTDTKFGIFGKSWEIYNGTTNDIQYIS